MVRPGPAAGEPATDGRRQAARRVLDLEACRADRVGDALGGVVLLEGGLGIGVDGVGQGDELVPMRLDGLAHPTLEVGRIEGVGTVGGLGHGCLEVRRRGRAVGDGRAPVANRSAATSRAASAFHGQRELRDHDQGDDEQHERPLEDPLDPEDDDQRDDERDPAAASCRPGASRPGTRSGDGVRTRSARTPGWP